MSSHELMIHLPPDEDDAANAAWLPLHENGVEVLHHAEAFSRRPQSQYDAVWEKMSADKNMFQLNSKIQRDKDQQHDRLWNVMLSRDERKPVDIPLVPLPWSLHEPSAYQLVDTASVDPAKYAAVTYLLHHQQYLHSSTYTFARYERSTVWATFREKSRFRMGNDARSLPEALYDFDQGFKPSHLSQDPVGYAKRMNEPIVLVEPGLQDIKLRVQQQFRKKPSPRRKLDFITQSSTTSSSSNYRKIT